MHDTVMIVLILLVVSLTIGQVLCVFRISGLRESNMFLHEAQSEAMGRAINAEREAARAEEQAVQLKATLVQVLQRPAIVGLTEENVRQLAALIKSLTTQPNQMN
jgi:hypothetical protein